MKYNLEHNIQDAFPTMNEIWQEFLKQQGAKIDDNGLASFETDDVTGSQSRLFDLSSYSRITIEGADAESFLHGQFSNDLMALDESHSQLTSYSTPKGRILALFRIMRVRDHFVIHCHQSIVQAFVKRLQMFVMRSDVTIKITDESHAMLALSGESSSAQLESSGFQVPAQTNEISVDHDADVLIARIPGNELRYTVSGPIGTLQGVWTALVEGGVVPVASERWTLQSIEAGQPEVYDATSERFVAQMINLQLIDGVNFKKGCYPGQEVIARLQYLGKLKRKMHLLECDQGDPIKPGDKIFADGSEEPAGDVVDAASTSEGSVRLLAVLKTAHTETNAQLRAASPSGPVLRQRDLPYALSSD